MRLPSKTVLMGKEEERRGEKQRDENRREEGVSAEKTQRRDQIEKEHLEEGPGCNGQRKRIKTKTVDIPEVEREKYFKEMSSVN